ncbi:MAG: undecaprenyl-diphosphatase UppP, partial [Gemmataceae bacterium]|nr:undecaprenyl-diphosphatase UppP [Gemmataceae bacterium]
SSTAHLLVAEKLLGWSDERMQHDPFTVVVQLGTLVAVVGYFRTDLGRVLGGVLADLRAGRPGATPDGRLGWLIAAGTVPAVVVGVLFKKQLKETFYNVTAVAIVATAFALLLAAAEWYARWRTRPAREVAGLGWPDAVWVGLWQACALMPGASRSGTTITGGLFDGLSRPAAARFSFLLSVPVILGAGLKDLYDEYKKLKAPAEGEPPSLFASGDDLAALGVGLVVSAAVGYLAIAGLLHFLKRYSTAVFVVYRLLLGGAILLALSLGLM